MHWTHETLQSPNANMCIEIVPEKQHESKPFVLIYSDFTRQPSFSSIKIQPLDLVRRNFKLPTFSQGFL